MRDARHDKENAPLRAGLYLALAEALDPLGPPEWIARAGREWPLYEFLVGLSASWPQAGDLLHLIDAISAEDLALRQARHCRLFGGPGRPQVWPYESVYLDGRVNGLGTGQVESYYQAAGMAPAGAELPDHASLELAFLAAITGREFARIEGVFLARHARRWLPRLGGDLSHSGDEVYGPLGDLLTAWFSKERRLSRPSPAAGKGLPWIERAGNCTLCGFCVQVCPQKALKIQEGETETSLVLAQQACTGCGRCVKICSFQAVKMIPRLGHPAARAAPGWDEPAALRRSPRGICRGCGAALVSQAELDYLEDRLGDQPWLNYCQDCRFCL